MSAAPRPPEAWRVGMYGALGRMGQMIIRALLLEQEPSPTGADRLLLSAAIESSHCPNLHQDVGPLCGTAACGIAVTADLGEALSRCDVVIDFSSPAATALLAPAAAAARVPLVIGTTGLHPPALAAISYAARQIPIVRSANMSPGINLLLGLVRRASKALSDYDAEIVEIHHRQKRDAPSGTALLLADAVKEGRGESPLELRSGREGQAGPREPSELGVFAVRGGDVAGEHTVMFLGTGERVELVHRASSREVFAQGALRAARWLLLRGLGLPGIYDMEDVLGLK
jgi:4-hydroxy-tetrahydrodipicolinate reductase